jgi:hypothetical protein
MEAAMSPVEVQSRPLAVRASRAFLRYAVVVAVAVLGTIGLTALLRGPEFVDHVIVENETGYDLNIDVTDGHGGGVIELGTTEPNRPMRVDDVIDQGKTWVFVVTRAGDTVARIRLSRAELESDGWRVILPESLEDALIAEGQQPRD